MFKDGIELINGKMIDFDYPMVSGEHPAHRCGVIQSTFNGPAGEGVTLAAGEDMEVFKSFTIAKMQKLKVIPSSI